MHSSNYDQPLTPNTKLDRRWKLVWAPSRLLHRRHVQAFGLAVAVLMLLPLFGPQTATGAQGVSVEVRSVAAVQVIEDVPLVVGKATVLRVDATASAPIQATLKVTFGPATKTLAVQLNAGPNTLFVPVDPPGAPGTLEISAQVLVEGSASNTVFQLAEVIALQRNWMKVIYIPVDWTGQDATRYATRYNQFVDSSRDFFKATYPFPEGNLTFNSSSNIHMLTPQQRAIVDGRGNLRWDRIAAMYSSIAAAGRRLMRDADLVVGVLPPGWFARNLNEPKTVGLELQAVNAVISSQVDADYATVAHEVGHIMGRNDEYDLRLKPPRIGNLIDAGGYWVARSMPINPGGGTYYSFMGAQDAGSQYWVNRDTYVAILQALANSTRLGR